MNEFVAWAERMKAHTERIRKLELGKDKYEFPNGDFDTKDELLAFRDGELQMIEMCINWHNPQMMKFDPVEAEKEL